MNAAGLPADSAPLGAALAECERMCETFPDDPELHVSRAGILFQAGRSVDAHEALERARELGLVNAVVPGAELDAAVQRLAAEDLPRSRPATLFVALAVYGIALIVAPRIAGKATPRAVRSATPPASDA